MLEQDLVLAAPLLLARHGFGAARVSHRKVGYDIAKRVMDMVLSVLLLPLCLPVILICAALVKLDTPGPAFFLQPRTGKGGRPFNLIKLRTMVTNAAEIKEQLWEFNQLTYPDFKMENDPRITRVGAFLRRTSLDELPNILNVLAGNMSLVGPRPTSFAADTYDLWQTARLRVLPGITGLWQVSGRSDIDFEERARLDIQYIERRSLWLDLTLLVRTFAAVLGRKGAY